MIDLGSALWLLRHPSCRRCPRCKLTYEPRSMMAMQGGVCHDCFSDDLTASTREQES